MIAALILPQHPFRTHTHRHLLLKCPYTFMTIPSLINVTKSSPKEEGFLTLCKFRIHAGWKKGRRWIISSRVWYPGNFVKHLTVMMLSGNQQDIGRERRWFDPLPWNACWGSCFWTCPGDRFRSVDYLRGAQSVSVLAWNSWTAVCD